MTDAQTEARAIAELLADYGLTLDANIVVCDRRVVDEAVTALSERDATIAAKDAELAMQREAKEHARRECDCAEAALAEARRERDEAIKAAGEQATLRGEAEGKLAASEMAGIVDGWKRRAEAYRTQRDEALKALEQRDTDIAEFMGRLGSRWFLEQGWFPKSVGAREDDARRVREGGKVDG